MMKEDSLKLEIGKLGHFGESYFVVVSGFLFSYFLVFFPFFFLFPLFLLEGEFYSVNQKLFRKQMQKKYLPCLPQLILLAEALYPPAFYYLTTGGEHCPKVQEKVLTPGKSEAVRRYFVSLGFVLLFCTPMWKQ